MTRFRQAVDTVAPMGVQVMPLDLALVAAAGIDNVLGVETLLDLGAPIAGQGRWSPLEEALSWGHASTVELLIKRGAPVDNLRKYFYKEGTSH